MCRGRCLHCKRDTHICARGLCHTCYDHLEIRAKYPKHKPGPKGPHQRVLSADVQAALREMDEITGFAQGGRLPGMLPDGY